MLEVSAATLYPPLRSAHPRVAEDASKSLGEGGERLANAALRRGPRALPGPDLHDRDLRGAAFVGADLEGADLRRSDLRGADLRGADLYAARLDDADLRGCKLDMSRLVEIELPRTLPIHLVNQIRAFDFRRVMARDVASRPRTPLPCPYRTAATRPLLYEWGSRTWNGGDGWSLPREVWTLEEIIGGVLDALRCRHDLARHRDDAARA